MTETRSILYILFVFDETPVAIPGRKTTNASVARQAVSSGVIVTSRKMTMSSSQRELHHTRVHAFLGTAGLLLGVALICLALIAEMSGGLPFFMPRSWYVNRSMWYFLAMACFVGGGYLLKNQPTSSGHWEASRPGVRFRRVVIYTRTDCELCDAAKQSLDEYSDYLPATREINIETDQSLIQRFGTCVPVVEIDGKVRFRGRLNEILLRRLIEGTAPLESQVNLDAEIS